MNIAKELLRLVNDEEGLTIVEYAVAGGLITVAVVGAFASLGTAVEDNIEMLCTAVEGSSSATASASCTN